jgi:dTDP-4-amino-4,6-dideoxygalactose transaminase
VKPSRHLFQIVVKERNKFMEMLNTNGIYPGVHYRDNTNYKMYSDFYGKCANSLIYSDSLISLPLHMNLSNDDIYYVVEKIIEIDKKINL